MKYVLSTIAILSGHHAYSSQPLTNLAEGKISYSKLDSNTALVSLEGDVAEAVFNDMIRVPAQKISNLLIKVGKSTTCYRGREVAKWKTVCYLGFSSLAHGEIDNSQTLRKP
jgi:hypothetical protein